VGLRLFDADFASSMLALVAWPLLGGLRRWSMLGSHLSRSQVFVWCVVVCVCGGFVQIGCMRSFLFEQIYFICVVFFFLVVIQVFFFSFFFQFACKCSELLV